jgi:hypothetical protein
VISVVVLFVALALVVVLLDVLCATGVIPRNHIVGLRLPALFLGDDAWRAGHRAAVMPAAIGAVVTAGVGWTLLLLTDEGAVAPIVTVVVLVLFLGWSVLRAHQAAVLTAERH